MAGVTKYLIWLIFLMCSPCCDCSPIKRSTNIQDADCYGTECYYYDVDTSTEIVLPENLTEVVLMNLPLISHSQGKIVNILERLSTQTDNQDQMVSLLSNQTVTLDLIATLLNNITGSLNTMLTKHDHMENMVDHQQESLSTLVLLNGGLKLKDCADIALHSYLTKPYMITPPGASKSYNVRCDFETAGGRWTVIQRRLNGSVDFYRFWQDYVDGFGDPYGEYWAGLEFIHLLTETGTWELRVDLEDFDGNTAYAHYSSFRVGNAASMYRLSYGTYSGTARNGMIYDNGDQFSTRDSDNDASSERHCAEIRKGGWWYNIGCGWANPNGKYLGPNQVNEEGLTWFAWKYTHEVLKKSEMKIRRI